MADDEKAVNNGGIETPEPSASSEQAASSEEEKEVKTPETSEKTEKPSGSEDLTEEELKALSVKAQKRFRQLAAEAKRAKELEAQLKQRSEEEPEKKFLAGIEEEPEPRTVSSVSGYPTGLPWETSEGGEREITLEEYERDVTQKADAIAQARVAQTEFRLRKELEIKDDYNKVIKKWDELNPESSSYNEDLSTKLAEIFSKQVRADPNTKLYDFVNSIMEIRQRGKEKGKEEVTAKLVSQKAEEAVTPSPETGPAPEKPEELFSDPHRVEEQEAWLKEHGLWE